MVASGVERAHECGELLATFRRPFERALVGERVHPRMERIEQRARVAHRGLREFDHRRVPLGCLRPVAHRVAAVEVLEHARRVVLRAPQTRTARPQGDDGLDRLDDALRHGPRDRTQARHVRLGSATHDREPGERFTRQHHHRSWIGTGRPVVVARTCRLQFADLEDRRLEFGRDHRPRHARRRCDEVRGATARIAPEVAT